MTQPIVHIVDDDAGVRKALSLSLSKRGYAVKAYESANSYLEQRDDNERGCIVLDVRMPGMTGLELQQELSKLAINLPIIFISGHADVPISVQAMKAGAVDFLQKPFRHDDLLQRIDEALLEDERRAASDTIVKSVTQKFDHLTNREKQIMALLVEGPANQSNKVIARKLDISHRTVEHHRARVMEKMSAESLTHLVTMAKMCGIASE